MRHLQLLQAQEHQYLRAHRVGHRRQRYPPLALRDSWVHHHVPREVRHSLDLCDVLAPKRSVSALAQHICDIAGWAAGADRGWIRGGTAADYWDGVRGGRYV